jgi:hypothetical protein
MTNQPRPNQAINAVHSGAKEAMTIKDLEKLKEEAGEGDHNAFAFRFLANLLILFDGHPPPRIQQYMDELVELLGRS